MDDGQGIDDATLGRMLDLAAVEVNGEARHALRRDLGRVLHSMDALRAADLRELPPTYGVAAAARMRPDEPVAGLAREAALDAAPEHAEEHFVLPSAMAKASKGKGQ